MRMFIGSRSVLMIFFLNILPRIEYPCGIRLLPCVSLPSKSMLIMVLNADRSWSGTILFPNAWIIFLPLLSIFSICFAGSSFVQSK
ncbi:hypothetical protein NY2A_b089R [Paramecium bursaria Chlorella virus NY2A]|uniref:Uncharacterized protein b089R n=1 Tax=Paramecium bursaria Chlorella virus NY2A TaxID=46021 RepID=A7IVW4_PBCVN|nr:hypothetical protein NY2A_b089R [Paramecium bursaria Chlorella virus NY2A]YP_001498158.1 hypothetical protein AR158_c076R [Paramecium bursaria Chlorella virus AR158]ABT14488.1 hypothetical protein NY2A_b089R [Paramecium bursaria Chlorella virus NY2A]ABU43622.1 hypothetical protein AR158_c076R [Paramecium bursaria Chlorella virus AR158]